MEYYNLNKQNRAFLAVCDRFGYIETGMFKDWFCESINLCGSTFAVNYFSAVNLLHEWLIENKDYVIENPRAKFTIEMVNGTIKNNELIYIPVYSISAGKAKKYLFNN